jgi:ketosteroid isomerase-like protein
MPRKSIKQINSACLILMFILIFLIPQLSAQSSKEEISSLRIASNDAIKSYDNEKVFSFLTDDILITTGNGTLLSGKDALMAYLSEAQDSEVYFVRTPNEIIANEDRKLAWEAGTWKGYDPKQGDGVIVGGNYAAMWTKSSGKWLIKSQLFVSLE